MLRQQNHQLVSSLQEMYRRSLAGQPWTGGALSETNGHPRTHDILAALNLLETKHDGSVEVETFEEDCQKLHSRLLAEGAGYMQKRGYSSSDSDHSQHGNGRSTTHSTPTIAKPTVFKDNFSFSASPSPLAQSPVPCQRHPHPPANQSPLHQSTPMLNHPQFYQPEWSLSEFNAMQAPQLHHGLGVVNDMMGNGQWEESPEAYDFGMTGLTSYPQQLSNAFGSMPGCQTLEWIQWISSSASSFK